MDQKNLNNAIRSAYTNAQMFLGDSEALQERGSYGHATSLAILGFEEAMKAYELTKFHPLLDIFYTPEDRRKVKERLGSHIKKQRYALEYRVAVESLLDDISQEDRVEFGFPSKKELQEGTEFALSERLNDMKNDGFYVDAFRNPFWSPSSMKESFAIFTQNLLRTQLDLVMKLVEMLSQLDNIPEETVEDSKMKALKAVSALKQAEKDGVKDLDELEKRLSEHGELGKIIFSLARAFVNDERFKQIKEERKKK